MTVHPKSARGDAGGHARARKSATAENQAKSAPPMPFGKQRQIQPASAPRRAPSASADRPRDSSRRSIDCRASSVCPRAQLTDAACVALRKRCRNAGTPSRSKFGRPSPPQKITSLSQLRTGDGRPDTGGHPTNAVPHEWRPGVSASCHGVDRSDRGENQTSKKRRRQRPGAARRRPRRKTARIQSPQSSTKHRKNRRPAPADGRPRGLDASLGPSLEQRLRFPRGVRDFHTRTVIPAAEEAGAPWGAPMRTRTDECHGGRWRYSPSTRSSGQTTAAAVSDGADRLPKPTAACVFFEQGRRRGCLGPRSPIDCGASTSSLMRFSCTFIVPGPSIDLDQVGPPSRTRAKLPPTAGSQGSRDRLHIPRVAPGQKIVTSVTKATPLAQSLPYINARDPPAFHAMPGPPARTFMRDDDEPSPD